MTAHMLLLALALVFSGAAPALAEPGDDLALRDAPPPVPLGIIEGSAPPVAPRSPRPVRRPTPARRRVVTTEKPMDRWARLPRPQSRSGTASAFPVSNGYGGFGAGGSHGGGSGCE